MFDSKQCVYGCLLLFLLHPGLSWANRPVADLNPRENVVEVELTAAPATTEYIDGVETEVWAYNGTVPGPTINGRVGQTLVVHFYNDLPEPTTIHWHGLEVPANMDGSNISQGAVPPGGYFRYEFKLTRAGTYWYHPHVNSNEQVEKGLQGALIVRDRADRRVNIPAPFEHVFMIDDVLLDESGQIAEFASDLGNDLPPTERALQLFNSRQGNLLLVNGKPMQTVQVMDGRAIRLRFINSANGRFMRLSAGDQRLYQIGTDGGLLNAIRVIDPVETIVNDEGDSISDPSLDQGMTIGPAERTDLVLVPRGEPGDVKYIQWHDTPTGQHVTFTKPDGGVGFMPGGEGDGERPAQNIIALEFSHAHGHRAGWKPRLPLRFHPIEPIDVADDTPPLLVPFGHAAPMPNGNVMFFNAVANSAGMLGAIETLIEAASDDTTVGAVPGAVMPPMFMPRPFGVLSPEEALQATVGETRIWYLVNFTGGDHTFHSHGFFFQPLEQIEVNLDGVSAGDRVERTPLEIMTKDTIHMPRRPGSGGRSWTIVKAAVRFDDSDLPEAVQRSTGELVASGKTPTEDESGGWLAHCHFLEHADSGMMNFLNLEAD